MPFYHQLHWNVSLKTVLSEHTHLDKTTKLHVILTRHPERVEQAK